MKMDEIRLPELHFWGRHGVYAQEKAEAQEFVLSVGLFCDLRPAGESDALSDSVDYSEIYRQLKALVEEESFSLLEALAAACLKKIFTHPQVARARISVCKLRADMGDTQVPAAVELLRRRPLTAYLGLGANLGDCRATLSRAAELLLAAPGVFSLRRSPLYLSAPLGKTDQADFWNAAVALETDLEPEELLALCQRIEMELGRVRREMNGPRTLDIDILLYGDDQWQTPRLVLPHPRLTERAFALLPLFDLAPELYIPGRGPLAEFLPELKNQRIGLVSGPEGW